jgi:ferric-chelate reductase
VTRDDRLAGLPSASHEGHDNGTTTAPSNEPTRHPNDATEDNISGGEATATPSRTNSVTAQPAVNKKVNILDYASIELGRPAFQPMISEILARADGETGVAVCGPLGLSTSVRRTVASLSACKGAAGQGIYLHVEGLSW